MLFKSNLNALNTIISFDKSWTIFLDRDGVINEKLDNNYVKTWNEFKFKEGALSAIAGFSKIFGKIIVVTNQRGVGLGYMSEKMLNEIHQKMLHKIVQASGRIDKIYYSIGVVDNDEFRKPNIGMGLTAKKDFPEIEFSKSVMVGDSISDMEFGRKLGMKTVYIGKKIQTNDLINFESLIEFYKRLTYN